MNDHKTIEDCGQNFGMDHDNKGRNGSIIATSSIINGEEIFLAFLKRSLGGKIPSAWFELLCQFGK